MNDLSNLCEIRWRKDDYNMNSTPLPLVSVIIPTYKRSDALSRAIDSALNQENYTNIEVVVVDDNNQDDTYRHQTEEKMKTYETDNRVIYVKHPQNRNGAAARNTGFKVSHGDYICLLDDDDIFLPQKIAKQVAYMEKHREFGASYTWRKDKRGNVIGYRKTGDLTKDILTLSFFPTTITLMIRRECYDGINGFDETFKRHQDFEFLLRFFEKYKIGVVNEPLSQILGGAGDAGRAKGRQFEEIKKQFLSTFESKIVSIDQSDKGFYKKVYGIQYADVFASYAHDKFIADAFRVFVVSALKYKSSFVKAVYSHYKDAIQRRKEHREIVK